MEETVMEFKSKFLGKDGLTQTSANHIANIAKEMYESLETKMESICLYNRDFTLAVNGKTYRVENESPKDELSALSQSIREVSELKALIAWLREGIKAKTALSSDDEVNKFIEDLIRDGRKDLEEPKFDSKLTFESVLAEMGEDTMARYYSLEARCATLGKFIHPDGAFAVARKNFFIVAKNPTSVSGKGQDAEISTLSTSYTADEVDGEFFALQKTYRALQAELNKLKSEVDAKLDEKNKAYIDEYRAKVKEVMLLRKEILLERSREVKALKIVLPQSLKEIHGKVNAVASAK